jgi:hypothetical protein
MPPTLPRWFRSTALPFVLLSTILAACSDGPAPLEPNRSVVEDSIEYMDPGQSYCDDDLWANGCTAIGDYPAPPPPPPSWDPCTSKPEGCYSDPGIGDPGDGGGWGGGGGAGGGDGEGGGADGGDSPFINEENWDCHTEPGCTPRVPSITELKMVQSAINGIRAEKDPFCGRIQSNATEMVNRHFRVWDQEITGTREDGSTGVVIGDVYWTSEGAGMHLWSSAIDAKAVAHESMHGMYWPGDSWPMGHQGVYGGRTMSQWQQFCTT